MIGRIYKIQHLDSSLCYIGSTCNTIRDRWRMHKNDFVQWNKGNDDYYTVALYPYLKQYGIDRFKMLLVKEYQIADKNQLRVYEQLAINRTKLCCNKNAALQLFGPKSLAKHYRQCIFEQSKEYLREYRRANKDVLKQKAATRVICECGTESNKNGIYKHRKTAKHARLLAALNTQ